MCMIDATLCRCLCRKKSKKKGFEQKVELRISNLAFIFELEKITEVIILISSYIWASKYWRSYICETLSRWLWTSNFNYRNSPFFTLLYMDWQNLISSFLEKLNLISKRIIKTKSNYFDVYMPLVFYYLFILVIL